MFAAERKRPLPKFPRRIGIVTSPAGAVIRDILHVLERRFRGLHVRVFPAQVQGEGAVEQVCRGIEYFSADNWANVLIVARGGGSIEDLWTFNEEAVARAISASSIPVISAVGHETDFTIADFVADLRAPTPSAAAELVICTRESLLDQVSVLEQRLARDMRYQLLMRSRRFEQRGLERAATLIHRAINSRAQQVDDLEFRLRSLSQRLVATRLKQIDQLHSRLQALDLRVKFARSHARLKSAESDLLQGTRASLWRSRQRLEALNAHLTQLSPLAVLARGYAIVQREDGTVLRKAEETSAGEQVFIRLSEGGLTATVDSTGRQ
jgi:exodeoxyribonuclease VII large subunit